jgi:hypothetical protein
LRARPGPGLACAEPQAGLTRCCGPQALSAVRMLSMLWTQPPHLPYGNVSRRGRRYGNCGGRRSFRHRGCSQNMAGQAACKAPTDSPRLRKKLRDDNNYEQAQSAPSDRSPRHPSWCSLWMRRQARAAHTSRALTDASKRSGRSGPRCMLNAAATTFSRWPLKGPIVRCGRHVTGGRRGTQALEARPPNRLR